MPDIDPLARYNAKRNFAKTAEPAGTPAHDVLLQPTGWVDLGRPDARLWVGGAGVDVPAGLRVVVRGEEVTAEPGEGPVGAADVVLQPVGRCGVRVTLVGADGVLGDTMVDSLSQAEAVRDGISGLTGSDWTRELVSRTDVPAGHWKRMAGSGSLV